MTEGVFDMRNSLKQHGSDLLLRFGKMEDVTSDIVRALQDNGDEVVAVFFQKEVGLRVLAGAAWRRGRLCLPGEYWQFYTEELTIERKLRKTLKSLGVKLTMFDQVPLSEQEPFGWPL